MYEKIKDIIKIKKEDIEPNTLIYFTNYFYALMIKNVIPEEIELDKLIDKCLIFGKQHSIL